MTPSSRHIMHELYPHHIYPVALNPYAPRYFVALGTLMLIGTIWYGVTAPFSGGWAITLVYALLFLGLATLYQLNNIVITHHA